MSCKKDASVHLRGSIYNIITTKTKERTSALDVAYIGSFILTKTTFGFLKKGIQNEEEEEEQKKKRQSNYSGSTGTSNTCVMHVGSVTIVIPNP